MEIQSTQNNCIARAIADTKYQIPWRRKWNQRLLKRALDFVVALCLVIVSTPVMLIIAVLVRLTSKGPILFKQTRLGLDGKLFEMVKFRSMMADLPDGSAKGGGEVTGDDLRLTPIGGWLRAWRFDELPQLFHVLQGKMSLVGPRPDILQNLPLYTPEQLLRFAMPPGCTAWTFTRGAFENDWNTRQNINVEYVQQWSFWLDLKIIIGTFIVLLIQKNTVPENNSDPATALERPTPLTHNYYSNASESHPSSITNGKHPVSLTVNPNSLPRPLEAGKIHLIEQLPNSSKAETSQTIQKHEQQINELYGEIDRLRGQVNCLVKNLATLRIEPEQPTNLNETRSPLTGHS